MTKFKTRLLRRDKLVLICVIVLLGILIRFALRTHNAVVVNDSLWQFISFGKLFQPLETLLLAVAIYLMTISSFFDVRKAGSSFKLFVAVASSLFLHAIIIGAHIYTYNLATKIADFLYLPESTISHYQEIVERDDTDAKYKAFFSAAIAREKFINRGEISKHIDEKGEIRTFEPHECDIDIRYKSLHLRLKIIPSYKRQVYIWTGVLLLSFVSGIFILKKRPD